MFATLRTFATGLLVFSACSTFAANPVQTNEAASICASPGQKIDDASFVPLGGIQQWVTVKGERCANPVLLVIHGGPGNPLSPYADNLYGSFTQKYTVVQWDQRGSGKTFGRNPPGPNDKLTLEKMADDGVQLAQYLTRRFGKKKIILMGGSWGSVLGTYMVKQRPELFHAWVAVSQMVSYRENSLTSYNKVLAMTRNQDKQAKQDKQGTSLAALEALGAPPWTNPRHFGVLRRAIRGFEAKLATQAPANFWVPAASYDSKQAEDEREQGEEYSFIQFVGLHGDGLFSRVELSRLGMNFEVPVFMIMGEQDLLTLPEVAKRFFDGIKAPAKEYFLVPNTGHDPNQALIDAQFKVLNERVLPLLQAGEK